ncbi:MAG: ribonuclease HIII [Candidatus Aenigmatarchaeota archaeon]
MNRIGVDESGKGDYFGYLVVAGVFVDEKNESKLKGLGVKDSKMIGDGRIMVLDREIRKIAKHEILKISPEKYNQLYGRFESLNTLLAWGHARVIENLLADVKCDLVISDKFADEKILNNSLFENGRKIKLIQKIHGESDISVAAASILARAEFLRTLKRLSREIGYNLPKGAIVDSAATEIVKKYGENMLFRVAKVHFKITKRVLKNLK